MMILIKLFLVHTFVSAALVSTPSKCLDVDHLKCSVWNKNAIGYELNKKTFKVLLQPEAIVSVETNIVELISGNIVVSTITTAEIRSSFASFVCDSCHAQLQLEKGKLVVQLLEGSLKYKSIDQKDFSVFPTGYQTTFYPVDGLTGRAKVEVFQVVDFSSFLNFFNNFEKSETYRSEWEGRKAFFIEKAREAASIYQQEAERQIASEASLKAKEEVRLEKQRKERAYLRRLFRQKNYLE